MSVLELIQLGLIIFKQVADETRGSADEKIITESLAGLAGLQEAIENPLTRERLLAKRFTPEW